MASTKKRKTDKIANVIETLVGTIVEFENGEIITVKTLDDLERLVTKLKQYGKRMYHKKQKN